MKRDNRTKNESIDFSYQDNVSIKNSRTYKSVLSKQSKDDMLAIKMKKDVQKKDNSVFSKNSLPNLSHINNNFPLNIENPLYISTIKINNLDKIDSLLKSSEMLPNR